MAVVLSAFTLLLLVVCLSTHEQPAIFQNSFCIGIVDGGFVVPNDQSGDGKTFGNLAVRADELITLNFTSGDFVYTVLQPEQNAAKVVLPGKSALMSLNLPPGTWELRIASGCGVRSSNHKQILYVKAVGQL